MRFVPLKNDLFLKRDQFHVAGKPIGVIGGYFTIDKDEKRRIGDYCQETWNNLLEKTGNYFQGHLRFDLVPKFSLEGNIGQLSIKDIYEVNAHSPECVAADAMFQDVFPEMKRDVPSAPKLLASFLKKKFGSVCMVRGKCIAKDSWGDSLIRNMQEEGLNLSVVSEKEVMKNNISSMIWRWGNVGLVGKEEFSQEFKEWLVNERSNKVFNTVMKEDVANKKNIIKSKEDVILTLENIPFILSIPSKSWVLKPLKGSSGNGIVFGKDFTLELWIKKLVNLSNKGYGAFRARWLPPVVIRGNVFAIDLNPSFFAEGKKLNYLYTVVRVAKWEEYCKYGIINVTAGGGYGNILKEV